MFLLDDLEDEHQRSRLQSAQLICDIQRITLDLDQETLARIHLENQKQTLEEEKHFLQHIHNEEIEECKQGLLLDATLNPSKFFRNQLAEAVKNIRDEYEQLNDQQQDELQSWYQRKVSQAVRHLESGKKADD
jgi:chemotaxis methyl-accepting protein methylase